MDFCHSSRNILLRGISSSDLLGAHVLVFLSGMRQTYFLEEMCDINKPINGTTGGWSGIPPEYFKTPSCWQVLSNAVRSVFLFNLNPWLHRLREHHCPLTTLQWSQCPRHFRCSTKLLYVQYTLEPEWSFIYMYIQIQYISLGYDTTLWGKETTGEFRETRCSSMSNVFRRFEKTVFFWNGIKLGQKAACA